MPDFRLLSCVLAVTLSSTAALASPELIRSKNCGACHHAERKMVGPAFKAIAERYAGNPDAAKMLTEKIRKGGSGNWGQMPMPPQEATVSVEEAEAMAKWILAAP